MWIVLKLKELQSFKKQKGHPGVGRGKVKLKLYHSGGGNYFEQLILILKTFLK